MRPDCRAGGFDTVILAGGGASRMDGADKPALTIGGTPMLVSVASAAAAAGTRRLIVVGPPRAGAVQHGLTVLSAGRPGWLDIVCEEPAGGGPVAGLRRGMAEVGAPWLLLLAADLPFLTGPDLAALMAAPETAMSARGLVVADADGRPQWLVSFWRADSVRQALGSYEGRSLRGLLAPLRPELVTMAGTGSVSPPWLDCDTPADLTAARRLVGARDANGAQDRQTPVV